MLRGPGSIDKEINYALPLPAHQLIGYVLAHIGSLATSILVGPGM